MTTSLKVDLVQGKTEKGQDFGYVPGHGGGFFFTWEDTLDATLRSVEEDAVDGDGDLTEEEVVEFLRSYLPTTKLGRNMWAADDE